MSSFTIRWRLGKNSSCILLLFPLQFKIETKPIFRFEKWNSNKQFVLLWRFIAHKHTQLPFNLSVCAFRIYFVSGFTIAFIASLVAREAQSVSKDIVKCKKLCSCKIFTLIGLHYVHFERHKIVLLNEFLCACKQCTSISYNINTVFRIQLIQYHSPLSHL